MGEVLTLSRTEYQEAKLARTPSSMTMELVRSAFSEKRRRKSSYAGQKRLRNGVVVQKPSLKKYRKMKDIQSEFSCTYLFRNILEGLFLVLTCFAFLLDNHPNMFSDFVTQRFSYFTQASFGHAVNQCTGKHVDKKPSKQVRQLSLLLHYLQCLFYSVISGMVWAFCSS